MRLPRMKRLLRISMCSNQWYLNMLFLCAIGLAPSLSSATEITSHLIERITPNGYYDWTTNTATATGLGVPPKNAASAAQSREMTRAAAWSVALANLLEVVNGIRVDAQTTVQNHVATNTEIQTRVEGMVKRAELIQEQEMPTGEFQTTVQMHFHENILPPPPRPSTIDIPSIPSIAQPSPGKGEKKNTGVGKGPTISNSEQSKKPYTGLLIDARGTKVKQVLRPEIKTTTNVVVYCKYHVRDSLLPKKDSGRIVEYLTDEATARTHPRSGANPLIIKAVQGADTDSSELVIDELQAQQLAITQGIDELRDRAKVVILLDPIKPHL